MIKIDLYEFKELTQKAKEVAMQTDYMVGIQWDAVAWEIDSIPMVLGELYQIYDLTIREDNYCNYWLGIEEDYVHYYEQYFMDKLDKELLRVYNYQKDNISITKNRYGVQVNIWDGLDTTKKSLEQLNRLVDIIHEEVTKIYDRMEYDVNRWIRETDDLISSIDGMIEYLEGMCSIPYFTEDGKYVKTINI